MGAADQLEDQEPPPPKDQGFNPRPPTDGDATEGEVREPAGEADPDANEARNRAVVAIVGALIIAGLALGGWVFTRSPNPGASGNERPTSVTSAPALSAKTSLASGNEGPTSATSAPAPPVKTSFLEIAGSQPLNGPIVVSNVSCYVPAYDPNSYEIDADATIGGTKVLLTALTSGSALGLPANSTYFDIHTDLAKPPSDATGWVSNQSIAIFAGHNSVTIDGRLLAGTVAGGAEVGRIDSTTLTCPP